MYKFYYKKEKLIIVRFEKLFKLKNVIIENFIDIICILKKEREDLWIDVNNWKKLYNELYNYNNDNEKRILDYEMKSVSDDKKFGNFCKDLYNKYMEINKLKE